MSGGNGVVKYEPCNREDQIILRTIGVEYEMRVPITFTAPTTLTGQQYLQDLILAGVGAITGPTAAQVQAAQMALGPTFQFSRFTQTVQNTTGAPITINMGAGFTPASIVIPPNTTEIVSWELTSNPYAVPPQPAAYTLFALYPSNPVPGILPGAANIWDVLVWNGAIWVPSTLANAPNVQGNLEQLNMRAGTNPLPFNLIINGREQINPNLLALFTAQNQYINQINIPAFTNFAQFGVQIVDSFAENLADPAHTGDSLLICSFSNVGTSFEPLPGPAQDVVDAIQVFNANPAAVLLNQGIVFHVDGSGNEFAVSNNVISDASLKTNIAPLAASSKLLEDPKYQGKQFHFKGQDVAAPLLTGLMADDMTDYPGIAVPSRTVMKNGVAKVIPACINQNAFNAFVSTMLHDIALRLHAANIA